MAANHSVDTAVRHLALEFLVSIVEAAPAMCRKIKMGEGMAAGAGAGGDGAASESSGGDESCAFAASVIPVCFSMMTELSVSELFVVVLYAGVEWVLGGYCARGFWREMGGGLN